MQRGHSRALCRNTVEVGRWNIPIETQKKAMGIDWDIKLEELSQAIPPAYTKWIGQQFMTILFPSNGKPPASTVGGPNPILKEGSL